MLWKRFRAGGQHADDSFCREQLPRTFLSSFVVYLLPSEKKEYDSLLSLFPVRMRRLYSLEVGSIYCVIDSKTFDLAYGSRCLFVAFITDVALSRTLHNVSHIWCIVNRGDSIFKLTKTENHWLVK